MAIETGVEGELRHRTYGQALEALAAYDDPAVHVRTIDGHLGDRSLVSSRGDSISFVDLTLCDHPDSSIVITAGRHSPEYGGAEAAMVLVDRILASPEMREYLRHGEVTIVPAVHVDEYAKPPEERMPLYRQVGYVLPPEETYKRYDADRNNGHDTYRLDGKPPVHEGPMSWFDQLYEDAPGTWSGFKYRESTAIPKETYAVAKLLEAKKAERGEVLFTADLHETDLSDFTYCTIVYDPALKRAADAVTRRVGREYPTHATQVCEDKCNTFSGFSHALGIDSYTTEGSPYDGWRKRPLAERVEQQLIAVDTLLDRYLSA